MQTRCNFGLIIYEISDTLFAQTIFVFLDAHNSRKIKNKIGFRFFASFERVSNSGAVGCGV